MVNYFETSYVSQIYVSDDNLLYAWNPLRLTTLMKCVSAHIFHTNISEKLMCI